MSFWDKLLALFGLEREETQIESDSVETADEEPNEKKNWFRKKEKEESAKEDIQPQVRYSAPPVRTSPEVVAKPRVIVVEPHKFTDARKVCRELKNGNVVVLNMEKLNEADSLRVYDVIQGAAFVLDASIDDISELVSVVAPKSVDVLMDEIITNVSDLG